MKIEINGFWEKFNSFLGLGGVSLNRACAMMEIPYTTMVTCKKKNQMPPQKYFDKIASFIGCTVDELVNDTWGPIVYNPYLATKGDSKNFVGLSYSGPVASEKISLEQNNNFNLKESDLTFKDIRLEDAFQIEDYEKSSIAMIKMPDEGMKDIALKEGDFVFFIRDAGLNSTEGRFVIAMDNHLTVRDISYDSYMEQLTVFSKNQNFQTIYDNQNRIKVIGPVVSWLHIENK